MNFTRQSLLDCLAGLDLEWADEEDAVALVDLLEQRFSYYEAYTWLSFHNPWLNGTPLVLLSEGKARLVFVEARRLLDQVTS